MTVNPGWWASFLPKQWIKYAELVVFERRNQLRLSLILEVDGGIDDETIGIAKEAGANVFVAGSYVFKGDVAHQVQTLERSIA